MRRETGFALLWFGIMTNRISLAKARVCETKGSPSLRSAQNSLGGSSRSSKKAQELAARAEHARRIADIENRLDARAAAAAEREKAVADLELEASLAVMSETSRCSSKVENWLDESHSNYARDKDIIGRSEELSMLKSAARATPVTSAPFNTADGCEMANVPPPHLQAGNIHLFGSPEGPQPDCRNQMSAAEPPQLLASGVGFIVCPEASAQAPGCHEPLPATSMRCPEASVQAPACYEPLPATSKPRPPLQSIPTHNHSHILGTHSINIDNCNFENKNKTLDNAGTQDSFIKLANVIADLGRKKVGVSLPDLPKFDGRAVDWLPFKRGFEQSRFGFTPSENLLRLGAALLGPAREAVAMLLVSADNPDQVIEVLESRFAQPEFIVLQQVSLVRSLPKLSIFDNPRELNTFACRVRSCVEVICLLKQPEYLASPELVNSILFKLTPLLRSRWIDFAATHFRTGVFKLKLLADFLENEAALQIKFGLVMSETTSVAKYQSQSIKPVKNKIYAIATSSKLPIEPKSFNLCTYCHVGEHEVANCRDFLSLSLDNRWQWVIDNKVCRKCLKQGSHSYKYCKKRCTIVGCTTDRRHHTLLHRVRSESTGHAEVQPAPLISSENGIQPTTVAFANDERHIQSLLNGNQRSAIVAHSSFPANLSNLKPLLKVVAVSISGPKGSVDAYALLDDGSSVTLLDQSVADLVGARGPKCKLNIDCIGGLNKLTEVSYVDIKVKGRHSADSFDIRARSISNLGINSQSARLEDVVRYEYLSDLVDVLCYDDAKPMLLIGADNWHLTLPKKVRQGSRSQPAAAFTALGWVLFGYMSHRTNFDTVNHVSATADEYSDDSSLDSLIKDYFKLDSIGIVKVDRYSASEERALRILEQSTRRLNSGQYETGLLWRDNISFIPESRELALARFTSLERKMGKDKSYCDAYRQNIQSMISKGYAELCTGPPSNKIPWYLPHFGVTHPQKKKLRVVHDAAAKCAGVSLNSMLLKGPDLLQPLLSVVMRFREGLVAVTGDIREMFPQVKIRFEDRDSQRFLWRDSPNLPLQEFRMCSMIFGAASSPFTALWVKNNNANQFQAQYPEAVKSIIEDHYMDDFLGSFDNVSVAAQQVSEILAIHKAACFEMRSWVSNCKEALKLIPQDLHAADTDEVGLGPTSPSQIRVLGLTWEVNRDRLHFIKNIPKFPVKVTKRSILSLLMSVYDPLGFLTPIIMKGRVLFQTTWKLGIDWDQNLSCLLTDKWKLWYSEIQNLSDSSIPRCYLVHSQTIQEAQLHVFADASERAYACVAYWRFVYIDGTASLALIGGKGRLAPLKPVSIPRLELQAALIASRFGTYVTEAHRQKPSQIFYWTDSLTVLKWIRSDACSFKAFVAFRVGEIVETTNIQNWKYVPTALNVADDATRDNHTFSSSSRWFTGPSFLLLPHSEWPCEPLNGISLGFEELKGSSEQVCIITEGQSLPSPVVADPQRFSNWTRLLRATARTHQCAQAFKSFLDKNINSKLFHSAKCSRNLPLLSIDILDVAERHLFLKVQLDYFLLERLDVQAARPIGRDSRLKNVCLVIAQDNLLKLSGRTGASEDVECHPIVLHGKHRITRLLIRDYHDKFAHANNELLVNELRQRFFIVGLRTAVKQVAQKCQLCRNRKTKPATPPSGDLPAARMAHHQRPFSFVGLDYFGPINVLVGRKCVKRWVALFTCLTVRAVHLEMVESLSSDSAIMSLRRFIARRGCPITIYSDNGTAFVGAAKILTDLYEFCSVRRIQWKFIPPAAPFMGGCWERLVRSVKTALSVTLKERTPKEEIFMTLLLEAEAVVNSRPLTHVLVDVDSESAITPFTFLIGTSSFDQPLRTFDDGDLSGKACWRKAQRLADHFWQRFVKEYLPLLVPRRPVPRSSTMLKVGDLVLVADGMAPRCLWPMGRITQTYPGKDRVVRVVDVLTKGGVLRRPVRKLALLAG